MTTDNEIISLVNEYSNELALGNPRPNLNRVVFGDCTEIMQTLPISYVDLIVTDPPYAAHYRDRSGRQIINDDNTDWIYPAFSELYRVLKMDAFCVSFYGWHKIDSFMTAWRKCGFRPVAHFTWVKSYRSKVGYYSAACHESAFLLAKGHPRKLSNPPPDVLPWKYSGNKYHPTQKPVCALQPLINAFSEPGGLVLDPFAGSGSTGVAAKLCNRQFLLIEKDEEYFQIANARLLAEGLGIAAF